MRSSPDSSSASQWAGTLPIQILSVTFADGSKAKHWAVVSDLGGKAEVKQFCSSYGGAFCIYPWFTWSLTGFHYGVNFPETLQAFGRANPFAQVTLCGGPFGANSTFA